MKKKVYIFSFILLILFGLYWFFILKKSAVKNDILNYADGVLCIDSQNISNSILKYYLFNPNDYFNNPDTTQSFNENLGVEIPDYIVFSLINTQEGIAAYGEFNLTDKTLFEEKIKQKGFIPNKMGQETFFINSDSTVFFSTTYGNKSLVVRMGLSKVKLKDFETANDLLKNKRLLSREDELYTKLKSSNNHATLVINKNKYLEKKSFLALNFLQGKVVLKGDVFNKKEYNFEEKSTLISDSTNIVNLSMNLKGRLYNEYLRSINKKEFNKRTNLNIDSIKHYFIPDFSFSLNNVTTSYDTSISYTYDENFNLVEETHITPTKNYNYSLELSKKQEGGFNYFLNDSLVKNVKGNYVFTPYPIKTIYVKQSANCMFFNTETTFNTNESVVKTNKFIDLYGDFSILNKEDFFERKSFNTIKGFSFNAIQSQGIKVNGELSLKDDEAHAIFVVLNMFKH